MDVRDRFRMKCVDEFARHNGMSIITVESIFEEYGVNKMIYERYEVLKEIELDTPMGCFLTDYVMCRINPNYDPNY